MAREGPSNRPRICPPSCNQLGKDSSGTLLNPAMLAGDTAACPTEASTSVDPQAEWDTEKNRNGMVSGTACLKHFTRSSSTTPTDLLALYLQKKTG